MTETRDKLTSLNSLGTLQENGTQFFSKVFHKYPQSFSCKEGCSKCCYVDLSVFEVEATKIVNWFSMLSPIRQSELKALWQNHLFKEGDNANGEKNLSCAFLIDEKCSIYEARPLICRTQGAPLYFQEMNKVDICPLNFKNEEMPPRENWLNVDRLNMLLALVQNQYAKEASTDSESRLSLKSIRSLLVGSSYEN